MVDSAKQWTIMYEILFPFFLNFQATTGCTIKSWDVCIPSPPGGILLVSPPNRAQLFKLPINFTFTGATPGITCSQSTNVSYSLYIGTFYLYQTRFTELRN